MADGKNFWQGLVDDVKDLVPGSLFGVGSSFVKGAIGNYFERKSLDYQAQLNEQAAVNAYKRQLDFWNKQNAYNDPSAQMSRLTAAGLNPALINANGVNNTAGGLSSAPQASPGSPNNNKPSPTDELNALADYAYKIKEMGFLDQQTQEKIEQILTIRVERAIKSLEGTLKLTETEKAQLDYKAFYEAYYGESLDGGAPTIPNNEYTVRINSARSAVALSDSETRLNDVRAEYQRILNSNADNQQKSDIAYKYAQASAAHASAAASIALKDKYNIEATSIDEQRWYNMNADARAEALHVYEVELRRIADERGLMENEILDIERQWKAATGRFGKDGNPTLSSLFSRFLLDNTTLSLSSPLNNSSK